MVLIERVAFTSTEILKNMRLFCRWVVLKRKKELPYIGSITIYWVFTGVSVISISRRVHFLTTIRNYNYKVADSGTSLIANTYLDFEIFSFCRTFWKTLHECRSGEVLFICFVKSKTFRSLSRKVFRATTCYPNTLRSLWRYLGLRIFCGEQKSGFFIPLLLPRCCCAHPSTPPRSRTGDDITFTW